MPSRSAAVHCGHHDGGAVRVELAEHLRKEPGRLARRMGGLEMRPRPPETDRRDRAVTRGAPGGRPGACAPAPASNGGNRSTVGQTVCAHAQSACRRADNRDGRGADAGEEIKPRPATRHGVTPDLSRTKARGETVTQASWLPGQTASATGGSAAAPRLRATRAAAWPSTVVCHRSTAPTPPAGPPPA